MAAIARTLFRNVSFAGGLAGDTLNVVVMFCAAGLFVSLALLVLFGLDLSPGYF